MVSREDRIEVGSVSEVRAALTFQSPCACCQDLPSWHVGGWVFHRIIPSLLPDFRTI